MVANNQTWISYNLEKGRTLSFILPSCQMALIATVLFFCILFLRPHFFILRCHWKRHGYSSRCDDHLPILRDLRERTERNGRNEQLTLLISIRQWVFFKLLLCCILFLLIIVHFFSEHLRNIDISMCNPSRHRGLVDIFIFVQFFCGA